MLAVTSVEGCRYCSYFHSKLALKGGISQEEKSKIGIIYEPKLMDMYMAEFYKEVYL